ncbi:hypothetical protein OG429_32925 [Streptomyces sp. NBC_00190]|uniref:hypothetical protein n=1 Tax=unclassified Streptomyces TaxID=2593676 RepID=UPI002E2A9CC9|nr:hypothetical protein [Streptomyces sp. NBC_00190]WSZ43658.1 hypothetical protein OG239_35385 [Streptomyces sp. NBC_00868]
MTPGLLFRAVRAAMFAAVCVLLTATGHILMSGTPVPWWALSAAFAATAATAWALSGRERGLLAVTAAAVAVQAALHAGFSLAQSLVQPSLPFLPPVSPVPEAAAHVHHAAHEMAHTVPGVPSAGPLADVGHGAAGMSTGGMLTAHLLAAVLCGLWLAHGERAVFRVVRAVAGWLWTPLRLLLCPPAAGLRPRVRVRRPRRRRAPQRLFLVHAITSRGPPKGTAVL